MVVSVIRIKYVASKRDQPSKWTKTIPGIMSKNITPVSMTYSVKINLRWSFKNEILHFFEMFLNLVHQRMEIDFPMEANVNMHSGIPRREYNIQKRRPFLVRGTISP